VRNYSLITVLILLAGAALGCSGEDNSRLNFYLVQQPPAGAAPQCSGSASTTTRLATNTYTLRLTFMRRDLAKSDIAPKKMRKKYSIVCDRVIKPGEALDFQVPTDKVDRLAMRLEAFQKSGTSGSLSLAYSGQMERVDLSGAELNMLLRTVDQRSCADTMRSPRAFHTATLLPNGQVLLLGGMVAEASGSGDKLHTDDTEEAYATAGAELYDPDSMSFTALDPGKAPPRAFHQAALLPSPAEGPWEVLVVGGLTPATTGAAVVRLKAGSSTSFNYPFLFTPHENSRAAEAGLVTITPSTTGGATTLSYMPLSSIPKVMFPRATVTPDGNHLLVTGGGSAYTSIGTGKGFTKVKSSFMVALKGKSGRGGKNPGPLYETQLKRTRVGHAVAPLGKDSFAVVGGTMDDTCGTPPAAGCVSKWEEDFAGESLLKGASSMSASKVPFGGTTPEASGWHTLTPLGLKDGDTTASPGHALLAGGFLLGRETDTLRTVDFQTPKSYPLMQLSDGATIKATAVDVSNAGAFKPAGYHAATTLADGSVLLSGGNVNSTWVKLAPCDKVATPFCAYDQLVVYGITAGVVSRRSATTKTMSIGRYGHRATRLLDNSVLFTGGVTMRSDKGLPAAYLTGFTEVYNPRRGGPAEDPFDRKAAQDYDAARGQAAGTTTCSVQEE